MELEQLVISLELNQQKFNESLKKVQSHINKFKTDTQGGTKDAINPESFSDNAKKIIGITDNTTKKIAGVFTKGLAGLGAYWGFSLGKEFITNFTKHGMSLDVTSKSYNINTKNLQVLQQLFESVGGKADDATQSVSTLYNRLSQGLRDPDMQRILTTLGINPLGTNGQLKDTGAIYMEMIDKIAQRPTKELRSQFVQQIGLPPELLMLVEMPKKERNKKIHDIADKSILSEKQIDDAKKAQQEFILLGQRWEKIGGVIADSLLPTIKQLTDSVEYLLSIPQKLNAINKKEGGVGVVKAIALKGNELSAKLLSKNLGDSTLPYDVLKNPDKYKQNKKPDNINSTYDNKSSLTSMYDFSQIKKVLAYTESGDNPNVQDKMYFGDDKRRGYGKYQVSQTAIKQNIGRYATADELHNNVFLEDQAKKYWEYSLKKANGNPHKAYQIYNGDIKGVHQKHWREEFSKYYNMQPSAIDAQTNTIQNIKQSSLHQNHNNTKTNTAHTKNIQIHSINLSGVNNPNEFVNILDKMTEVAFNSSGNILA